MKKILEVLGMVAAWAFVCLLYYTDATRTGKVCGYSGCQIVTTPLVTPGWAGYFTVLFWMTTVVVSMYGIFNLCLYIKKKISWYRELKEAERYYRENGSDYYRF